MYNIHDILKQSQNAEPFTKEQLVWMLSLSLSAPETYLLMAEAKRISKEATGDKAEVHGQFALNLAPCGENCKYCSFAVINQVFTKSTKLTPEEVVESALHLEDIGANAVYMMATANYPFGEILEMTQEVRKHIKPETWLIANVGDRTKQEALQMADAGLNGVYHAMRLREGVDTDISPLKRMESFDAFREAGLSVGTCVEPVGPEHRNEEIADLILLTASLEPAYSGAARRISIPGTELAQKYGMISELRQAQCVAVTRLAMPRNVKGNCTHEPCVIGAAAGANLFWAEIGANPRDIKEKTEDGRGFTVQTCRGLFQEADCGLQNAQSEFYKTNLALINH